MLHRVDTGVPPGLHRHIAVAQPGQTDSYRDIAVVNLSNTRLYRHDRGFFFLEKVSRFITVYLGEAILIHIHNICFYGEISKIINLHHFHFNPRLPLFLLYVRWKSGVTFVWRCFCDVCPRQVVEKCFLEID